MKNNEILLIVVIFSYLFFLLIENCDSGIEKNIIKIVCIALVIKDFDRLGHYLKIVVDI
ncbi:hypothetical protein VAEKB19_5470003 [Vibrio aestuarianus]|nr:hypothetical protein VAEKB19_5470003 [Vibrio aestuarianus]